MRVLGLDASTTTIGISVIDSNDGYNKLVYHNFYKPPKKFDIFYRLNAVREEITNLIKKWQPDCVALEDIILFMKGHSTAKTISSLAVLNRTVGLAVLNALGKPPELFNVMKIRHCLKLTKDLPAKEDIPELVAYHLNIDFPWRKNSKDKIIVENYDVADSMAVALTCVKSKNVEKKPPSKRKKKVINES